MSKKTAKKEMAGDYEILQKIRLGGKVLIFGHNPKDAEAPYMTCYQQPGFWNGYMYPEAIGGADYFEIMQTFVSRLQEQAKVVERFRQERNLPITTLDHKHCRARGDNENLEGKLIILRSSSLAPEYRTADCQLGFATGGFGCIPGAGGSAVYFEELYSGEHCRWEVGDVLGIADHEKLPDWAKEKLAEREAQRAALEEGGQNRGAKRRNEPCL